MFILFERVFQNRLITEMLLTRMPISPPYFPLHHFSQNRFFACRFQIKSVNDSIKMQHYSLATQNDSQEFVWKTSCGWNLIVTCMTCSVAFLIQNCQPEISQLLLLPSLVAFQLHF